MAIIVKVDKELSKGSHEIIILKMLSRKDMYGYQLIQEMEMLTDGVFSMSQGSLYPFLHLLEKRKLIDSYEKMCKGRKRRYYCLTNEGKAALLVKEKEWDKFTTAVRRVLEGPAYGA